MDMFVIRGGRPLRGSVSVSGAKNAALPLMAASIAADGPVRLRGVPDLADVKTLSQVLTALGVHIERAPSGELILQAVDTRPCEAPYDLVRKMRASICVLGPLLGRRGQARVSLPGGCNIGHRPIDLHLHGLEALGADLRVEQGYIVARADRLVGATVDLGGPHGSTVTGTCNIMMAAVLAEGTTTILSAACEPEVADLGRLLKTLGARITGLGTPTVQIHGVKSLGEAVHEIIPDRIEAATLMMAAAATRGHVRVSGVRIGHLQAVIHVLRQVGVDVEPSLSRSGVECLEVAAGRGLNAIDCTALPYPAFPTDLQAQLTTLLTQARGTSIVVDRVFPNRFMHVSELCRMGANIRCADAAAIIQGPSTLQSANVMASDLRASAGLVIAGLIARGETAIRRIYHLDRGYERLESKLQTLGADVRRIQETEFESKATVAASPLAASVEDMDDRPARAA
jgi:UDP-N-acetylglucosamine 1-carboxyvinyltransferase